MQQIQAPVLALGQKQIMAPQMREMMRLLAMPVPEIKEEIQKVLDTNPALEAEGNTDILLIPPESGSAGRRTQEVLEGTAAQKENLKEHLLVQLGMQKNIDQKVLDAAEILVQNLNNDGFLDSPPKNLVPEADDKTLEKAMELVQMMDPQGTCVYGGYKESLLVQASLRPDTPEHTDTVISDYLEALGKEKYKEIAAALHTTESQVQEIKKFIRTLNPFPGRTFNTQPDQTVVPSFTVTAEDGEISVDMNEGALPVLKISSAYEKLRNSPEIDSGSRKFIQDAEDFIRKLAMRKGALERAGKEIVKSQQEFFLKGPKYLKPLTQREFAKKIDVSESTVSRIANSKFIQTDWGFYPFSYFFPSQGASALETIKEIIESHKSQHLSDQQISDLLKERGVEMARRTVSKYRRQL